MANYSKVYFLGPILEKTAFELMLEGSPMRFEAMYMKPVIPQYVFEVEIEASGATHLKPILGLSSSSIFNFSLKDVIREDKATVPYFFKGASFASKHIEFDSPLKERAVIFKPEEIPKVPMWITQEEESFKIELEFTVSPNGIIEEVRPIVSSGYPNVDVIGMDYLKRWRFAPLEPSEEQKDQSGRIEVELNVD